MLCRNPFVRDKHGKTFFEKGMPRRWYEGIPFGCGQCLACRVKKRREWTTRLALEMIHHHYASFLTLTYDEHCVPVCFDGRTLDKDDFQRFMKRFRRNLDKEYERHIDVRYYMCGEYGTRGTERPHYHVILFGLSSDDPKVIRAVHQAWCVPGKGGVPTDKLKGIYTLDPLTEKRCAYVAGYVMKKLVKPSRRFKIVGDRRVLDRMASSRDENGRLAEFRLMSRRPGLGADSVFDLVALFRSNPAFRRWIMDQGDVPSKIRHFGKLLFLDRFIKTKLRDLLGITPDYSLYYEEMKQLYFEWFHNHALHKDCPTFTAYLVSLDDQRYKQLEAKVKRQLQRRSKI